MIKKLLLLIIALVLCNQTTYGQEVTIGNQIWQTTNLNVTTYSDGTQIPYVPNGNTWAASTTGAYCTYNDIYANGDIYGKIYNWYAVAGIYDSASLNDPSLRKQIAPQGWHVASDEEWTTLTTYLGGESIAGGKMKSTGTTIWNSPNVGATNSSGFTALPGGIRGGGFTSPYSSQTSQGFWWTSSETYNNSGGAWYRNIRSNDIIVNRGSKDVKGGLYVRCVKNASPLSNTTFDKSSIELYPNPTISFLNVSIDSNLINQTYNIVDGLGRVIIKGNLNDVDVSINVEQLSKGIYYLKVSENKAIKFIKD